MKKSEYIKRYGEDAYKQMLARDRARYNLNREKYPEKVEAKKREMDRKGGKYYERKREYDGRGLRKLRCRVRQKHAKQWRKYKRIIAPNSQIHHEWLDGTAEYRGFALVETKPHRYGIIDVILILDGKITVLTEEEVKNGGTR